MPDYGKLKVTELKEELGRRGLPKGGLKADLVQRLEEADAQNENHESDQEQVHPPTDLADDNGVVTNTLNGPNDSGIKSATEEEGQKEVATSPDETNAHPSDLLPPSSTIDPRQADGDHNTESVVLPGNLTQPLDPSEDRSPAPIPSQSQDAWVPTATVPISTQTTISPEELLEDSKKRKRRSQSPPPASLPISQKKIRTDTQDAGLSSEASPLQEPISQINGHAQEEKEPIRQSEDKASIEVVDAPPPQREQQETEMRHDADVGVENTERQSPDINGQDEKDTSNLGEETAISNKVQVNKSPPKPSTSDTRFKSLFTSNAEPTTSVPEPTSVLDEERDVPPSIHPATPALYIRELMRPLNPKTVKDHLISLATSPGTEADPSIITQFFLDTIRTHCLVSFVSVAAASRARSGLHDRIWPNERDRRALWVDFVPEEKLEQWIGVEQESSGGRGQASKRWEVTYEEEHGEIKAYLREVGTGNGGLRTTLARTHFEAGQSLRRAPGTSHDDRVVLPPRNDHGKGFKALDDLFKSTIAKPKLYYLPVSKRDVDRRLDLLDEGRGGGRSDEMRRYTFENDMIVDKGPENRREQGGYRGGRGGYGEGNYRRGRGGWHRGEAYRDGGDTYRRPAYR